ncbi:hypothetical protein HanIR_Chr16g0816131 [Helianthus annuus]|nr:hypothetical protein HanIR_Chr16g0816131 [Helianthus annuus]
MTQERETRVCNRCLFQLDFHVSGHTHVILVFIIIFYFFEKSLTERSLLLRFEHILLRWITFFFFLTGLNVSDYPYVTCKNPNFFKRFYFQIK